MMRKSKSKQVAGITPVSLAATLVRFSKKNQEIKLQSLRRVSHLLGLIVASMPRDESSVHAFSQVGRDVVQAA